MIKYSSNEATDDGSEICFNDEHSQNAHFLIDFSDGGSEIFSNAEHLQKEEFPIDVTDDGINIFIIKLMLQMMELKFISIIFQTKIQ